MVIFLFVRWLESCFDRVPGALRPQWHPLLAVRHRPRPHRLPTHLKEALCRCKLAAAQPFLERKVAPRVSRHALPQPLSSLNAGLLAPRGPAKAPAAAAARPRGARLCPGVAHRAPALQTLRRRGALGGAAGLSGAVREQQEKGMGLAQRDGQEEP